MSDERVKRWENAKMEVKKAEEWNNLPKGKKYCTSTMKISMAHCHPPKLKRMGQQECGGQSYWATSDVFGKATLKYLVENWDTHYPEILKILKKEEHDALMECQSYVDMIQAKINSVSVE
jgi:hypothetical protein